MSGPQISVVIPAHNKASVLIGTLEALRNQTLPAHEYEVIVVDDGSDDDTAAVLAQAVPTGTWRVLRQDNRGAGAARLSARGRALVEARYDWAIIADQLDRVYQRVAG